MDDLPTEIVCAIAIVVPLDDYVNFIIALGSYEVFLETCQANKKYWITSDYDVAEKTESCWSRDLFKKELNASGINVMSFSPNPIASLNLPNPNDSGFLNPLTMSFALQPDTFQPSGYTNMSRISDVPTADSETTICNYRRDTGEKHGICRTYRSSWLNGELRITNISHYRNGKLHGYYANFNMSGDLIEDMWYLCDEKHGRHITYHFSKGTIEFVKDYGHGDLRRSYVYGSEDRLIRLESYKSKLNHGIFLKYDENGVLQSLLKYKRGVLEGEQLVYYKSSYQLHFQSIYLHGIRHGKCFEYDRNGKLLNTCEFQQGKLHEYFIEYYSDGNIEKKTQYVNGEVCGEYVKYFPDGNIDVRLNVNSRRQLNGHCITYYSSGRIYNEGGFINGKRHGIHQLFDEDGALLEKARYHNGALSNQEGTRPFPGFSDSMHHLENIYYHESYLRFHGDVLAHTGSAKN
jgi:antitoxin component YwqK of YwqJK toxin-antitoxin module